MKKTNFTDIERQIGKCIWIADQCNKLLAEAKTMCDIDEFDSEFAYVDEMSRNAMQSLKECKDTVDDILDALYVSGRYN